MKKKEKAPSSVRMVKLSGRINSPSASATKSWKTSKWPENDQFRQFHFLIKRFFDSNCTSIDAESQMQFFEITYRFLGCSVNEILTKNVLKNRSTKFRPPDGHRSRKVLFRCHSEFNEIWQRCYWHLVKCVGQVSSAFDWYFSRKTTLKIDDNCHYTTLAPTWLDYTLNYLLSWVVFIFLLDLCPKEF